MKKVLAMLTVVVGFTLSWGANGIVSGVYIEGGSLWWATGAVTSVASNADGTISVYYKISSTQTSPYALVIDINKVGFQRFHLLYSLAQTALINNKGFYLEAYQVNGAGNMYLHSFECKNNAPTY